jgi:LCP family protein required for cell wall assembly
MGEQNLLVVGLDARTDAQGNPLPADVLSQLHAGGADEGGDTTDTMIVIHIPAGGGQATAISIPRDSYVQLASGFGQHKINSAYTYGKVATQQRLRAQGVTGAALETESDQAGARTAIQTVQQFTGLTINHYAAVNLAGFAFISQAVGGVTVCLKAPVHDSYSGANFPAGPQTVSGSQALAFVRQRYGLPNGDLDRIKRQQAFMASMASSVLSGRTFTDSSKLRNVIAAIKKAVVLDAGFDILSVAQQLQGIRAGDIHFVTIPITSITLHTPDDGDAVQVDPMQVQTFIQQQISQQQISGDAVLHLDHQPAQQPPVPTDPPATGGVACVA